MKFDTGGLHLNENRLYRMRQMIAAGGHDLGGHDPRGMASGSRCLFQ